MTNKNFFVFSYLLGCLSLISLALPCDVQAKPDSSKSKVSKTKKSKKRAKKAPEWKKGKVIFDSHCASCHQGGQNTIKPSKKIIGSRTLATYATFKAYLNKPIGNMPHYEHLITNDKLLKAVYKYAKKLDDDAQKAKSKSSKNSKEKKPAKKKASKKSK